MSDNIRLIPDTKEKRLKGITASDLVGKLVKVTFNLYVPARVGDNRFTGENMWVLVDAAYGDWAEGVLDNDAHHLHYLDPHNLEYLKCGDRIQFPVRDVLAVEDVATIKTHKVDRMKLIKRAKKAYLAKRSRMGKSTFAPSLLIRR